MPPLEWILVFAGAVIALLGAYLRRNPERLFPADWDPEPAALAPLRRLGSGFVFMGVFLALQMAVVETRLPFWCGTLAGIGGGMLLLRSSDSQDGNRPLSPPSHRRA